MLIFSFECDYFDSFAQECVLALITPIYQHKNGVGSDQGWNDWRKAELKKEDEELLLSVLPDPSIRVSPAVCGMDPIRSYSHLDHAKMAPPQYQLHSRPLLEAWKENLVSSFKLKTIELHWLIFVCDCLSLIAFAWFMFVC